MYKGRRLPAGRLCFLTAGIFEPVRPHSDSRIRVLHRCLGGANSHPPLKSERDRPGLTPDRAAK